MQMTKQQARIAIAATGDLQSRYGYGYDNNSKLVIRCIPIDNERVRAVMQEHGNGLPFRIAECELVQRHDGEVIRYNITDVDGNHVCSFGIYQQR